MANEQNLNDKLNEIYADLVAFKAIVHELKINNTETYDSSLEFPTWRNIGSNEDASKKAEDYEDDLRTNTMCFKVYKDMLVKPDPSIKDESINKKALSTLGKALLAQVSTYQENVINKKIGERLLSNLSNLDTILKMDSRPDNAPPRRFNR